MIFQQTQPASPLSSRRRCSETALLCLQSRAELLWPGFKAAAISGARPAAWAQLRSRRRAPLIHLPTYPFIPAGPGTAPDARPRCGLQLPAAAGHRLPALPSWKRRSRNFLLGMRDQNRLCCSLRVWILPVLQPKLERGVQVGLSRVFQYHQTSFERAISFIFSSTGTTLNSPMTCHRQASAFSLTLRQL